MVSTNHHHWPVWAHSWQPCIKTYLLIWSIKPPHSTDVLPSVTCLGTSSPQQWHHTFAPGSSSPARTTGQDTHWRAASAWGRDSTILLGCSHTRLVDGVLYMLLSGMMVDILFAWLHIKYNWEVDRFWERDELTILYANLHDYHEKVCLIRLPWKMTILCYSGYRMCIHNTN